MASTVALVLLAAVAAIPLVVAVARLRSARYWARKTDPNGKPVHLAPTLQSWIPFGIGTIIRFSLAAIRGDELQEVSRMLEADGLTCRLDVTFTDHAFLITGDPEVVAWVTSRNFENYEKGPNSISLFRPLLGEVGWRRRRALGPSDYWH